MGRMGVHVRIGVLSVFSELKTLAGLSTFDKEVLQALSESLKIIVLL